MTTARFKESLSMEFPPEGLSVYLKALWFDGKGEWEKSHNTIQHVEDATASWIHAYLHRKEADIGNADYWYRRAGRKRPATSLHEEWEDIVNDLIQH